MSHSGMESDEPEKNLSLLIAWRMALENSVFSNA